MNQLRPTFILTPCPMCSSLLTLERPFWREEGFSGQATSDSLRAYELPALEAVPVSAPLGMQGSVTAIWPAPDSRGVYAAVRTATNQYEVDHVAALCN